MDLGKKISGMGNLLELKSDLLKANYPEIVNKQEKKK
jgi:hypothetical protein